MIKIDIDGKDSMTKTERDNRIKSLLRISGLAKAKVHVYRTKRGKHLYISLWNEKGYARDLSTEHSIIAQLILGSDPKRELFNLERTYKAPWLDRWNVLFQVKYKNGKVVSQERFVKIYEVVLDGR